MDPRVIAARLARESGTSGLAFVATEEAIYYAREPFPTVEGGRSPHSAVTSLIQGLYELDPARARALVRRRIYSTAAPTPMCRGMVKVAAKRLTAPIKPDPACAEADGAISVPTKELMAPPAPVLASPLESAWGEPSRRAPPQTPRSDAEYMALAFRMTEPAYRARNAAARGRPIAALLVSREGSLLSWAINTDFHNRTRHAEVNLLQGYFERTSQGLPSGSRIYTTLKPCRMCAGMIWHCTRDLASLRVFYGEDDPGPHARNTALTLNCSARDEAALACGDPALARSLELQAELKPA
ncbi:MAG: Bd3614 family nucleic acid deaminase [Oligoflexia bacterium]|nr:Bd3614 family nucleic acid deaminase [Oligoflexia bacterium]